MDASFKRQKKGFDLSTTLRQLYDSMSEYGYEFCARVQRIFTSSQF